ncbi:hypothetical protein [Bradyrhizobium japonicum]|uniref:hypothetical protein n=1 Tax=Bradyrhizobium japonicum TaxID=375 RepID=UPI00209D9A42|nr:hypothetical protein [Bradyrhizobium japonicum]MCP1762081.1 hypothetical protein [Bradyrhizobium japonicum]MCP1793661.1 hypothetical protein [Bradyrhizobium japonicum]MCP1806094.1 hypothetical protein [Bradyrhizobium japonicum]MCP1815022.1 hypothetical protein [Bradyrhizobium japonicum]MCP1873460.1 hypothetical protein [Bradyrhizobium japonicum]
MSKLKSISHGQLKPAGKNSAEMEGFSRSVANHAETEGLSRSVASMLATTPTTVEQNLARIWHHHVDDLVAVGVPAAMAEHSMLAAALVRAARSEGGAAAVCRLRDAADEFERELLAAEAS